VSRARGAPSSSGVLALVGHESSSRLTTTSYAVPAQLALRPWSTCELTRQRIRYFRYVWPRAESAIYRDVKRLAAKGLATATREYVGKRPRSVYSITEAGEQTLREWLDPPVSPFAMDFEAMIRLFIALLGTKKQIVATLEQVRSDSQDMLHFGRSSWRAGPRYRTRSTSARLPVDFFVRLLHTVDGWAERTPAEIEGWENLSPDGKNERGARHHGSATGPNDARAHRSNTVASPNAATPARFRGVGAGRGLCSNRAMPAIRSDRLLR
jgi:PadR family transcriptional regulator, regulatory protein AphA